MARTPGRKHPELIALERAARRLHAVDRERFRRVLALAEAYASMYSERANPDCSNPDLEVDAWVAQILPPRQKTLA